MKILRVEGQDEIYYQKGHSGNQFGGQIKRGDTRIRWLSGSLDKKKQNKKQKTKKTMRA